MIAWVVGNGESLKKTPLEELGDTFATNRIHHIYNETTWRPTYYVRTEPPYGGNPDSFFAECRLHIDLGEKCIFPWEWQEVLGGAPNIEYIKVCRHFKYPPPHKKAHLKWHLPTVCDTSVITAAMQVAVLKGYSEIRLVGCDLTGGHFSKDDDGLIQTDHWKIQHEIAKENCPIPIYNYTVGGNLEVYERKDVWGKRNHSRL